jgi:hypothetical protein
VAQALPPAKRQKVDGILTKMLCAAEQAVSENTATGEKFDVLSGGRFMFHRKNWSSELKQYLDPVVEAAATVALGEQGRRKFQKPACVGIIMSRGKAPEQYVHIDLRPGERQFTVFLHDDVAPTLISTWPRDLLQSMIGVEEGKANPAGLAKLLGITRKGAQALSDPMRIEVATFGEILLPPQSIPLAPAIENPVRCGDVVCTPGGVAHCGPESTGLRSPIFFSMSPLSTNWPSLSAYDSEQQSTRLLLLHSLAKMARGDEGGQQEDLANELFASAVRSVDDYVNLAASGYPEQRPWQMLSECSGATDKAMYAAYLKAATSADRRLKSKSLQS